MVGELQGSLMELAVPLGACHGPPSLVSMVRVVHWGPVQEWMHDEEGMG